MRQEYSLPICQGDFERSLGLSFPSGRTALKGTLQPLCPVKLLAGSCRVSPCPVGVEKGRP